jgi:predicted Zn-dependent protease
VAYQAALKLDASATDLWKVIGMQYAGMGAAYLAQNAYQHWADARPDDAAAQSALEQIGKDVSTLEEREQELQTMLAKDPNSRVLVMELGRLLNLMGASNRALALYDERLPDDGSPLYQIVYGDAYVRAGRPQEAIDRYEKARDLAPDDPRTRYALARQYHRVGRDAEARAQIDAILSEHPNQQLAANMKRALGW